MQGSADKIILCMIAALLLPCDFWPLLIHFEQRWLYNWCRSWNSWLAGLWWDYDPGVVSRGVVFEGFWPRPCGPDSCAKVWCKSCYITGFMSKKEKKKKRSPDLCQRRLTSCYRWLFCFVLLHRFYGSHLAEQLRHRCCAAFPRFADDAAVCTAEPWPPACSVRREASCFVVQRGEEATRRRGGCRIFKTLQSWFITFH